MSRHTQRALARLEQEHGDNLPALLDAIHTTRGPHRTLVLLVALHQARPEAEPVLDAIRALTPRLSPASQRFLKRKGVPVA